MIAFLGDGVGQSRYLDLLLLVVEPLHEYEQILIEVHGLLPQSALNNLPVAFGHFYFATALAPVKQRDLDAYLHNLVVFQVVVGSGEFAVGAGVANLGKERDLAQIAFGFCHFIVASS